MRRPTADDWAGFVMLGLCLVVPVPVLVGVVELAVPLSLWAALFAVAFVALLGAAFSGHLVRQRWGYAVALALGWFLVLSAQQAGLLPILLVMTAAVGAYHVVPLVVSLVVVVANAAVIGLAEGWLTGAPEDPWVPGLIVGGFYLLIQVAVVLSVLAQASEQRMRCDLGAAHVELQAQSVLLAESSRSAERARISRDLHDLVGHQLTVLTLELEAARHRPGEAGIEHVERANSVARELLGDVRSTVGGLRETPGDLGANLAQVGRDAPGLDVHVRVAEGLTVDERHTEALVRAMQEIVTNALRHSHASALTVDVGHEEDRVMLVGTDDGVGARDVAVGNGLRGLAERFAAIGGGAAFDGSDGFRVRVWVPAR